MADGDIGAAVDSLVWNALTTEKPRAVHVTGNVWAICYEEFNNRGKVSTVEIDTEGNIGAALLDTLTFEVAEIQKADIIKISANVFAVVYEGDDSDGFVKTLTINNNGSMGDVVIDSFEFDTTNCRFPKIVHVAGTTYAIAIFYNRLNGPGRVVTMTVSDAGDITQPEIASRELAGGVLLNSCASLVDSTMYAYVYAKSDWKGYITTVEINAGGIIGMPIATFNFEPNVCNTIEVAVLRISATILCVIYAGVGEDGFMKTIEISDLGAITDPAMGTLEFDTERCLRPSLIHISGDVYAVFYGSGEWYGTIKTPTIGTPGAAVSKHLMMIGLG